MKIFMALALRQLSFSFWDNYLSFFIVLFAIVGIPSAVAQAEDSLYGDEVITADNLFIKDEQLAIEPASKADSDLNSIVEMTFGKDSDSPVDEAWQAELPVDEVNPSLTDGKKDQPVEQVPSEQKGNDSQLPQQGVVDDLLNGQVLKDKDEPTAQSVVNSGEEQLAEPLDRQAQLKEIVGLDSNAYYDISDLKSASASTRLTAAVYIVSNQDSPVSDWDAAVKELGQLLQYGNSDLRKTSMEVLKVLGPEAKAAVHLIEVALHKGTISSEGIDLLRRIGDRNAVEGLANLLSHKDKDVERAAMVALGGLGSAAQPAVENLLRLLADRHASLAVLDSLEKIGGARVVAASISLLNSDEKQLRIRSAELLGNQGRGALRAVPALRRMASSTDPEENLTAREALIKISKAMK